MLEHGRGRKARKGAAWVVNPETSYEVIWTPNFEKDVYLAVHYIEHALGMPRAARRLLGSVVDKLEGQRIMPECAVMQRTSQDETRYVIACGKFNLYYVIEENMIKAIGFKHQLRS